MTRAQARDFVTDSGARFLLADCRGYVEHEAAARSVDRQRAQVRLRDRVRAGRSLKSRAALWQTAAPMRLFALRGANSVDGQRSRARSSTATDELMRELMERNELTPEAMVSCIFTLTDDLDAEFPAVAARALGLDRVPLLCAREVPVPGSLPRVIRVLVHYYARRGPRAAARLPGRRRASLRARPRVGTIGPHGRSSSPSASGGSRLPAGRRLRPRRRRRDARLQRVAASRRCPRSSRPPRARARRAPTATRPVLRAAAPARCRTATGSRPSGSRSATARATSCSRPARRCSSRAPRSSTRGRRSASTRTSPPPRARARSRCRSTPTTATTSTRSRPRSRSRRGSCWSATPTTRPRPRVGLDEIDAFLRAGAAPRVRDPRRGLLRVRARARRHRTRRSSCCAGTRTSCCCGRSRRSTGWRGCGSGTRCAAPRTSASRSTRSASRSTSTSPRRRPRSRRCATRTRSSGA